MRTLVSSQPVWGHMSYCSHTSLPVPTGIREDPTSLDYTTEARGITVLLPWETLSTGVLLPAGSDWSVIVAVDLSY